MNKKRAIVASVVLALVLLVGGILAYFTDTDSKTNVFTIGNVRIQLNEAGWTEGSTEGKYGRNEANNLTPNAIIPKAPIVENIGTNDAFVFVKVEMPMASIKTSSDQSATNQEVFTFTLNAPDSSNAGWVELSHDTTTGEYVFAYVKAGVSATGNSITKENLETLSAEGTTPAVFNQVVLKDLVEAPANADLTQEMPVTAYGIQADNVSETTAANIFAKF